MPEAIPLCTACRYRLEGETSRWESQCPLRGKCPECGSEIEWRIVMGSFGRLRWAFDVPGVRGIAYRRWLGTTLRLLWPSAYWRNIAAAPLQPNRLWWWFVLVMVQLHVINAIAMFANSWPYILESWWRSTGTMMELFLAPYCDMGEANAKGMVEPIYFLDRLRVGLACGSLAAGVVLWLGSRLWSGINKDAIRRAVIYGLLPLAFMYVLQTTGIAIQVLGGKIFGTNMSWWYGVQTPSGRTPGAAVWFGRTINLACVLWCAAWWWHASGAAMACTRNWARLLVTGTAIGTATALFLSYLNYWNRWWTL